MQSMPEKNNMSLKFVESSIPAESVEIVELLVSLGADHNTAKTLICLHTHGPSKSIDLQKNCNLRQPDVSIAINRLRDLNVVRVVPTNSTGRGRPSHIYELSVPLEEALIPFRTEASERLAYIQSQLSRLGELAKFA